MKIAIVGSRNITEEIYDSLCEAIPIGASMVISGGANGVDALAEKYAIENRLPLMVIRPEYDKYGKCAPLERNKKIIEQADYVLAFWDGKSRGTAQVIDTCVRTYVPVKVIMCHNALK